MAGRELGFPAQQNASSLKEQLARKTLRHIRLQGHTYVDLREDGKRYIFFCTLCLAPCYSDTVLIDHLRGSLHKERYAAAEATLLGPNPWPFNDGILFFHSSDEKNGNSNPSLNSGIRLLDSKGNGNSQAIMLDSHKNDNTQGAIIIHPDASANNGLPKGSVNSFEDHCECDCGSGNGLSGYSDRTYDMVIPGVMAKDELCELGVKLMGYGQISARLLEKNKATPQIKNIWCEWLGKTDGGDSETMSEGSDFGIVTFRYYYDLGKQGLFEEIKSLLTSKEYNENLSSPEKRQRKSFSDPEDASEFLSSQWDSAGEDSSSTANSRLLLDHYDDKLLNSRIISSKTMRRELRRQQRLAAERMCDICQHKMLPGKDVAALLNTKTGKLACSRRNTHGAFHVFHISCLIHWILLCESEMFAHKPVEPNIKQRPQRKTRSKSNESGKQRVERKVCAKRNYIRKQNDGKTTHQQIQNVFCPDCQGTGMGSGVEELEKPIYHLSEIFRYKIKLSDARRSWMKHPEKLENCSTGLDFELQDAKAKEKVSIMKLIRFYRADDDSWIASS